MSEEKKEVIFVDGLIFQQKKETDQDFVLGRVAIKADELTNFIAKYRKADGWLNIDFLRGQSGKPYFKLNTWEKPVDANAPVAPTPAQQVPAGEQPMPEYPADEINPEDIPF